VNTTPALELLLRIQLEPDLLVHVDTVDVRSREEEGKVERVSVVSRADSWAGFSEVLEESTDGGGLLKRTTSREAIAKS
jgi:hypothetical protein